MGGRGNRHKRNQYHYSLLQDPPFLLAGGQIHASYRSKFRHSFKYIDKNDVRIQHEREDDQKQPCDSPSPTPSVQYIPNEVILQILYKLPLRSQLMCKLVSKGWLDMISNPHRMDSCLSYRMSKYLLSPQLYGFLYHDLKFSPLKTYSDLHNMEDLMTLGREVLAWSFNPMYKFIATSCGFLLFRLEAKTQREYVICNPHTKETRVIPMSNSPYNADGIGFYCDIDRNSPNLAHYSVVLVDRDYKVTGISNVKIFSRSLTNGAHFWKDLCYTKINCNICLQNGSRNRRLPVGFINGVLYCTNSRPGWDYDKCCSLIAFDLNPDKLKETHTTLPVDPQRTNVCVCVFSNRLFCCGLIKDATDDQKSRICTLKLFISKENPRAPEDDFGWQTEYSLELSSSVYTLQCFHPRNPRMVFFTTQEGCLKCYDFQNQEVITPIGSVNNFSKVLPYERLPWPISLHK